MASLPKTVFLAPFWTRKEVGKQPADHSCNHGICQAQSAATVTERMN